LAWHFDQAAIDAEAGTDGWYALLTNLDPEISAAAVFHNYKGQEAPERRYHNFKGPIAVAPMFLHNNRRIEALISVICLALLIFALVERSVRIALSPTVKLAGLPAKPHRPAHLHRPLPPAAHTRHRCQPRPDPTTPTATSAPPRAPRRRPPPTPLTITGHELEGNTIPCAESLASRLGCRG